MQAAKQAAYRWPGVSKLSAESSFSRWAKCIVVTTFASLWLCGCGRKNEDFIPTQEVAEAALEQVLDSWKAGKPAGEVAGTKPVIFATDTSRKPEQTLLAYRILGETPGTAGRMYAVVLDLDNPVEQIKTQYIVVGIDPLWVFRQEDYELLMHWDHYMPANPNANPPAPDTASETSSNTKAAS